MIVAGVDISTKSVDVVVLGPSRHDLVGVWSAQIDFKADDDQAAFRSALRAATACKSTLLRSLLEECDALYVERPFSVGRRTVAALMRVQGVVLACCPGILPRYELPPHAWKKGAGLSAAATKEQISELVTSLYPAADRWTQDLRDAYAIACAGLALDQGGE